MHSKLQIIEKPPEEDYKKKRRQLTHKNVVIVDSIEM
jgi:hypothetical protein